MKVGDKVVCVNISGFADAARGLYKHYGITVMFPRLNHIYTIRKIIEDTLRVDEIVNPILDYIDGINEHRFYLWHFRPLTPLEAWQEDEQEAYLEYIERIAPGIETETLIEK